MPKSAKGDSELGLEGRRVGIAFSTALSKTNDKLSKGIVVTVHPA